MPLSKTRMRERKRQDRASVKPISNLNALDGVKPKLAKVGIIMKGNKIIRFDKPHVKPKSLPYPDNVELDADGNIVPSYT